MTTEVSTSCLCKTHVFAASVPATAVITTHCDMLVEWPNINEELSTLRMYPSSQSLDVFFCETCSSLMFWRHASPSGPLYVNTAVLENSPNLVRYGKHIFVGETLDGGATMWLRKNQDGSTISRWDGDGPEAANPSDEIQDDWPASSTFPAAEAVANLELTPFRCHCGGIDLILRSASDLASQPAEELPWFIDPKTHKYLAGFDGCNWCRLSLGVDVPNWAFAPLSHIQFPTGTTNTENGFPQSVPQLKEAVSAADSRDPRLGTLTYYQSSSKVERYFCSRCSATVFYSCHPRPDMVDIAIGLLRHPSGARAEGLLFWNFGQVGWSEHSAGGWREALVQSAAQENEEWRIQRGYPKSSFRLMLEGKAKQKEEGKK
ncbi:hypothetical protein GQ53DRAFT_790162 [Thozetella sp. PMI_491]|nr:hypothetical protein GQ53DRAFT_790162 [Thozetella sp. PMI_491]